MIILHNNFENVFEHLWELWTWWTAIGLPVVLHLQQPSNNFDTYILNYNHFKSNNYTFIQTDLFWTIFSGIFYMQMKMIIETNLYLIPCVITYIKYSIANWLCLINFCLFYSNNFVILLIGWIFNAFIFFLTLWTQTNFSLFVECMGRPGLFESPKG